MAQLPFWQPGGGVLLKVLAVYVVVPGNGRCRRDGLDDEERQILETLKAMDTNGDDHISVRVWVRQGERSCGCLVEWVR